MRCVIINEDVTSTELSAIRLALPNAEIRIWPDGTVSVPSGFDSSILLVRAESSDVEERRAIGIVGKNLRITCIRLQELESISKVAEMFCSAQTGLQTGDLAAAVGGDDSIQKTEAGKDLPEPKRERNVCK